MKYTIDIAENDLETYLVKYIDRYFPLKFIKKQYNTPAGIIDILAKYKNQDNTYFVIELRIDSLDSDAVCQVLRYTQYMNSEMSKEGKRKFYPLLIGKNIDENLCKLVSVFNGYPNPTFYCQYSLYNISFYGLSFNFLNPTNEKFIKSTYKEQNSHIENLELEKEALEIKLDELNKKLENSDA